MWSGKLSLTEIILYLNWKENISNYPSLFYMAWLSLEAEDNGLCLSVVFVDDEMANKTDFWKPTPNLPPRTFGHQYWWAFQAKACLILYIPTAQNTKELEKFYCTLNNEKAQWKYQEIAMAMWYRNAKLSKEIDFEIIPSRNL